MRFTTAMFMAGLMTAVSAHFQLQFPPPRGPFVEDNEPTFCDGYVNSVDNRTTFPTSGGFISINSEHPSWTLGGIVATVQNPTSFPQFKDSNGNFQQFLPFFQTTGEGSFCVDVDLAKAGVSGLKNGANVTLQFVFDGGDGELFQCADVTLADNFTIPTSISCKNATNAVATPVSLTLTATGTSTSPSGTSPAGTSAGSSPTTNAATHNAAVGVTGVAGLIGAIFALF